MPKKSIADKLIKKVEVKLDGKAWPIVITHNVLIEVEELSGLNVLAGEANLAKPSAKLLRAVLFVALQRAGAKYTIGQVGDLIGPHNMVQIQQAILTAWAASMPDAEPEDDIEADPTLAAVE